MPTARARSRATASSGSDIKPDGVLPLRSPATVLAVTIAWKEGDKITTPLPWTGPIAFGSAVKFMRDLMVRDTAGSITSVTYTVTLERQS